MKSISLAVCSCDMTAVFSSYSYFQPGILVIITSQQSLLISNWSEVVLLPPEPVTIPPFVIGFVCGLGTAFKV